MDEPIMDGRRAREILDQYYPRNKRFVGGNYSTTKFNIIGFGLVEETKHRTCPFDPGVRLIKHPKDGNMLLCPRCGYQASRKEAPKEPDFKTTHQKTKPAIITGKGKKKQHYSDNGEEIKDSDLINEHVTYYHEELPK